MNDNNNNALSIINSFNLWYSIFTGTMDKLYNNTWLGFEYIRGKIINFGNFMMEGAKDNYRKYMIKREEINHNVKYLAIIAIFLKSLMLVTKINTKKIKKRKVPGVVVATKHYLQTRDTNFMKHYLTYLWDTEVFMMVDKTITTLSYLVVGLATYARPIFTFSIGDALIFDSLLLLLVADKVADRNRQETQYDDQITELIESSVVDIDKRYHKLKIDGKKPYQYKISNKKNCKHDAMNSVREGYYEYLSGITKKEICLDVSSRGTRLDNVIKTQHYFEIGDLKYIPKDRKNVTRKNGQVEGGKHTYINFTNCWHLCDSRERAHWFSYMKPITALVPRHTMPINTEEAVVEFLEEKGQLHYRQTICGSKSFVEPYQIYTEDFVFETHENYDYIYKMTSKLIGPMHLMLYYEPIKKILTGFYEPVPTSRRIDISDKNIIIYPKHALLISRKQTRLIVSTHDVVSLTSIINRETFGAGNATANVVNKSQEQSKDGYVTTSFNHLGYLKDANPVELLKSSNYTLNIQHDMINDYIYKDGYHEKIINDLNDYTLPEPITKPIVMTGGKPITTHISNKQPQEQKTIKCTVGGESDTILPSAEISGKVLSVTLRYMSSYNSRNFTEQEMKRKQGLLQRFAQQISYICNGVVPCSIDDLNNKYKDYKETILRDYKQWTYAQWCNVDVFPKGEPTGKIKGNRNISAVETEQVIEILKLVKPVSDTLKAVNWYGPGKNTIKFLDTLACAGNDFSQFDGSIQYLLKTLYYYVLTTIYPQFKDDITLLVGTELFGMFKLSGRHMEEKGFKLLVPFIGAVLSGGGATAPLNTWISKYVEWEYLVEKKGMKDYAAMQELGRGYGDDSNSNRDFVTEFSKYVSDEWDLKMKAETKELPGQVKFLGKSYMSNEGSLCAQRAFLKWNVSFGKYKDDVNLLLKWAGYYNPKASEESKLPIFGDLGQYAHKLLTNKQLEQVDYTYKEYKGKDSRLEYAAFVGGEDKLRELEIRVKEIISKHQNNSLTNGKHKEGTVVEMAETISHVFVGIIDSVKEYSNVTLTQQGIIIDDSEYLFELKPENYINYLNTIQRDQIFHDYCRLAKIKPITLIRKQIGGYINFVSYISDRYYYSKNFKEAVGSASAVISSYLTLLTSINIRNDEEKPKDDVKTKTEQPVRQNKSLKYKEKEDKPKKKFSKKKKYEIRKTTKEEKPKDKSEGTTRPKQKPKPSKKNRSDNNSYPKATSKSRWVKV